MAATQTVPQVLHADNSDPKITKSLTPRHGVITLSGYGIKVNVHRGHLVLDDGIGPVRGHARLPRVRHGLRQLVVIGSDGMVSLAALRWLADQKASFVMLERDGRVLATTGPVRPSDVRLRRAQSLAHHSGIALEIAQYLIKLKLNGQELLVREKLNRPDVANVIAQFRSTLERVTTIEAVRFTESQAASAYWSAWRNVPIHFPKHDESKVPEHWKVFGTRASPLTGSPRLAVNPAGALLNYVYSLLEAEARLAAAELGLDPGMGVLHVDAPRDSLALDLMEAGRAQVDRYVLDWITQGSLRRAWFFEKTDGNTRLMAPIAERLSETSAAWASAIAPVAESVARMFSASIPKQARQNLPATRLTQSRRREARVNVSPFKVEVPPRPPHVCEGCGASIHRDKTYCMACGLIASTECLVKAAVQGRQAAQSNEAQASRSQTQRRNTLARYAWKDSDQPDWLTKKAYVEQIQPRLAGITSSALSSTLGVSRQYAINIRAGRRRPHPRHWETVARLVGLSKSEQS